MSWRIAFSMESIQGRRPNNEDSIFVEIKDGQALAIVADGMGGQAAGEVASNEAILSLGGKLQSFQVATLQEEKDLLVKIFAEVNESIIELGKLNALHYNMGTTVVLVLKPQNRDYFLVAHLGDSRAYEWSENSLQALTSDNTVTQFLLKQGIIKPEQVANHPFRNRLLKYLGTRDSQEGPDISIVPIKAGQRILLCSDGLLGGGIGEKELADSFSRQSLTGLAGRLCQAAYDSGSADNISCVVLDVSSA